MKLPENERKEKDNELKKVLKETAKSLIAIGSKDDCLKEKVVFPDKLATSRKDTYTKSIYENCNGRMQVIGRLRKAKSIELRIYIYPRKTDILFFFGFCGGSDQLARFTNSLAFHGIEKPIKAPVQQMPTSPLLHNIIGKFILEKHGLKKEDYYAGVYFVLNSEDPLQDLVADALKFYSSLLCH